MSDLSQHYSPQLLRMALWSIAVAFGVLVLKMVAWMATGSLALYSDALESIINVVTAVAAWLALRQAQRPPDLNHPFGHQKVEYLTAVLEGALIALAAVMIARESIIAMMAPQALDLSGWAVLVSLTATAVNFFWARRLIRTGKCARSPALEADGHHIMTDVVSTVGVVTGLGLAAATGWPLLDPLLALGVAAHILWQGWAVMRGSLAGLLDEALEEAEVERIAGVIRASGEGAIEMHDLMTRRAGPVTFIEFHLIVDGEMSVRDSHAICDRVERALTLAEPGARIVIHVEPEEKAKPEGLPIL